MLAHCPVAERAVFRAALWMCASVVCVSYFNVCVHVPPLHTIQSRLTSLVHHKGQSTCLRWRCPFTSVCTRIRTGGDRSHMTFPHIACRACCSRVRLSVLARHAKPARCFLPPVTALGDGRRARATAIYAVIHSAYATARRPARSGTARARAGRRAGQRRPGAYRR